MATIDKRGPYQYRVRVRRKGYPEQVKTLETKVDATAWARLVESKMDRGVFISMSEAEATTFDECLTRYLRENTANKKGWKQERTRIKKMQQHPLASRVMASIRSKDIAKYRDARLSSASVKSATTVLHELKIISHVFNTARKEWGMEGLANPVEGIAKPHPPRPRNRRLEDGEEQRLLLSATSINNTLPVIIKLTLETAMRRGELAALFWKHIDLKKRVIHLSETKNNEARDVPLSSKAIEILKSMPHRINGHVFDFRPDTITHAFKKACNRAKSLDGKKDEPIENLRFHDLRHEATSRLFEKGLNPMQVAAITGHKTLQMLKRYTHLRAEDLAKMLG